jgi:hypothetical protein
LSNVSRTLQAGRVIGHSASAAASNAFERLAGSRSAVLLSDLSPDLIRSQGVAFVVEKAGEFTNGPGDGVGAACDRPGHTQTADAVRVVRLIGKKRDNEHRPAGAHRLGRRPNAAMMDDRRSPGEQLRERGVINGHDPFWERRGPDLWVISCHKNGPPPKPLGCLDAVLVESPGGHDCQAAEREDKGRRAAVQEQGKLGG